MANDMGGSGLDQRREIARALIGFVRPGERMVTTLGETIVILGPFDFDGHNYLTSYNALIVPPVPWEKPYEKIVSIESLLGRAQR